MSPVHRWLLKWSRTVHLYLTLLGLGLILFFAVTGFMLNHEDWFADGDPHIRTATGVVPSQALQPPDRLAVVEALRNDLGATGAVQSFDEEEDCLRVVFQRPGSRVEAVVRREDGETEMLFESRGLIGWMTDLHRGKASGWGWSLVIDTVCVMLLVISATGLVLWSSLRSRGHYGVLTLILGVAISVALYMAAVP